METLCTRLSGRLRVLAHIFFRTPPSLPQPCRTPGPASVSDAVKQGLTRWWRVLPMRWPTGAASKGCRGGGRRGETSSRGPTWEREWKTRTRTVCVIISKPRRVGFISSAFISKSSYFTCLKRHALFGVFRPVWPCLLFHVDRTFVTISSSISCWAGRAPLLWNEGDINSLLRTSYWHSCALWVKTQGHVVEFKHLASIYLVPSQSQIPRGLSLYAAVCPCVNKSGVDPVNFQKD